MTILAYKLYAAIIMGALFPLDVLADPIHALLKPREYVMTLELKNNILPQPLL